MILTDRYYINTINHYSNKDFRLKRNNYFYYINTINQYSNKEAIIRYTNNQSKKGNEYKRIFSQQMSFDFDI